MSEKQWPEVAQAFKEKRRELVLSGSEISKRIDSDGLDETIYRMSRLNFLEVCKTTLEVLNENLGNMENLTNLVLHTNHLKSIPSTIGKLSNLKILDLSNNKIEDLPVEFGMLKELHTVNISANRLSALPQVENLTNLHVVNFSCNQFEEFPNGLCHSNLKLLNTVNGSFNAITTVPQEISNLLSLKNLDLSNNKLLDVAPELCECSKVKELNLKENCFKDRRFGKLVQQCQPKSVLDYLAKMLAEKHKASGRTSKKERKKKQHGATATELPKDIIVVKHFKDDGVVVQVADDLVKDVRPYIVCCVVNNVAFNPSSFKAFIAAQTKLHDGPLCDKRQKATIATHDLGAICAMMSNGRTPLLYTAKKPTELKLTPLGRHSETTAEALVASLRKEADDYRREKKRHNFSGIHKYLDLLKDKPLYPCLMVKETEVISFPPITNCQCSKISKETTDILIEVTSSISQEMCKKVLEELLAIMLVKGHGASGDRVTGEGGDSGSEGAEGYDMSGHGDLAQGQRSLTVEQVKVLDEAGHLKVIYPSRVDLQSEAYSVERES